MFGCSTIPSSISSFWTQDTGTWTISSGKVKTTNQGAGILLASPDVYVANYSLKVTVPVDQGDSYAGLVIAHDGDDTFYAVVFNSTFGLKLFHVVDGSWGSSLKEVSYSIGAGDYILRASYRQGRMQASLTSTADPPDVVKRNRGDRI